MTHAVARTARLPLLLLACLPVRPQSGETLLLVVNESDSLSRRIAEYYARVRAVPPSNVCKLRTAAEEEIAWQAYENGIERPVAAFLRAKRLTEKILYIVTTGGLPLKIAGGGSGLGTEQCAVDSELALLYAKMHGARFPRGGAVPNPFYRNRDEPFRHPRFPIYLVTRLAGYDFADVKAMLDRSLVARNRGKFVFDLNSPADNDGNQWLRTAAMLLPAERVELEESTAVVSGRQDVIGYASWGSNDSHRKQRGLGFRWLPGAIATEFVSTNGRTFRRPPDSWAPTTWQDRAGFFAGSPQSLTADYIHDGATGASGHVYEPYLSFTPRPDFLFPAYFTGRNLAESYYLAIPALSWQNIVVGDPLCRIGKP